MRDAKCKCNGKCLSKKEANNTNTAFPGMTKKTKGIKDEEHPFRKLYSEPLQRARRSNLKGSCSAADPENGGFVPWWYAILENVVRIWQQNVSSLPKSTTALKTHIFGRSWKYHPFSHILSPKYDIGTAQMLRIERQLCKLNRRKHNSGGLNLNSSQKSTRIERRPSNITRISSHLSL